jgi:hypothetical protein
MYVPPYGALLNRFGAENNPDSNITIPLPLFQLLLQFALTTANFDENAYLAENPDVADAVRDGVIESGYAHFIAFGFFENRKGVIDFDEAWYLATNADVASAVELGSIGSGLEHFYGTGAAEGRSPNATQVSIAGRWRAALHG